MIDSHHHPLNWGIRPIFLDLGFFQISSYAVLVILGLLVGSAIYFYESKKAGNNSERGFFIAFGSLIGGVLGAKILQLLIYYQLIISNFNALFSGRTIIGGLIGGMIGAKITKRILKIEEKRGNYFAPAIAIGVAIGRLGCFFKGCCYGKPTSLPWGINFGDGILRHPTQLYESLFMLVMFIVLEKLKYKKNLKPGELFKWLMLSYFTFRFFIEFIRVEEVALLGLTYFQFISVIVIIYFIFPNIQKLIKNKIYGKQL